MLGGSPLVNAFLPRSAPTPTFWPPCTSLQKGARRQPPSKKAKLFFPQPSSLSDFLTRHP